MANREIILTPVTYFKGMTIPTKEQLFKDKFEGGLKCGCPSNVTFFELKKWKAHIKGKRHIYFEKISKEENEININYEKIIKQLKTEKCELSQKLSQSEIIIRDLKNIIKRKTTKQIIL